MTEAHRSESRNPVLRFASRLRFPQLFLLTGALFVADLLIPDLLPFADEVLLGLLTLLLGTWKENRNRQREAAPKPPMKNVTPSSGVERPPRSAE